MILVDRDLEILEALNTRVRVLPLALIAAWWWNAGATGRKNAGKRLGLLVRAGFLRQARLLAHPCLALERPECAWCPGERPIDFGPLAWRLQSRWSGHPRRTTVYFISSRAVAMFGGRAAGRLKNLCQMTHDLHVGAVYLAYRRHWPDHAACWLGEDSAAARRCGQKVPDALLVSQWGEPYRAIEFGGRYSARRLTAFHNYCHECGLPYEIW